MDPTKRAVEPSRRSSKRVFPRYRYRANKWCCGNTATIPNKKLLLSIGRLQNKNGQTHPESKVFCDIFDFLSIPNRKGTETISIQIETTRGACLDYSLKTTTKLYTMMQHPNEISRFQISWRRRNNQYYRTRTLHSLLLLVSITTLRHHHHHSLARIINFKRI